jgi:hypothetical protein
MRSCSWTYRMRSCAELCGDYVAMTIPRRAVDAKQKKQ